MDYYNYRRTHQGYKLKKKGYRTPAEAHLSRDLTEHKESSKVKISKSIRGEKEAIEKSLIFACGSDKINGVKEEVMECSLVTTS